MESLIITPANHEELALIKAVLKKMNLETKVLTDEEKEDIGMALLMSQADRSATISREEVMKKLRVQCQKPEKDEGVHDQLPNKNW